MKQHTHRQPVRGRRFSWGRVASDEACTWRLFRRDHANRVHMSAVTFGRGTERDNIAGALWHARIRLRDRVDSMDLQAWGIAA